MKSLLKQMYVSICWKKKLIVHFIIIYEVI